MERPVRPCHGRTQTTHGEVQTVSNSFAPEFGKTACDIYNVISGSGTNQFHGDATYIGRPLDLVARPILATPTTLLPVANDFAANAALIGIPANLLANPPAIEHAQWVDGRLDWVITPKHQFFVRYNYFRNQYPFNSNVGGLNALSVAADFRDPCPRSGRATAFQFSPTILNELRFGCPYRNEQHVADPLTGTGPEISISGIANFGGSNSVADRFQEKVPNLNDNFTVVKGAPTFKAAFGFQQNLDVQAAAGWGAFLSKTSWAFSPS